MDRDYKEPYTGEKKEKINLDTDIGEIKDPSDPKAGENSGIPGSSGKDVGNVASGATAAGTKGRGTASHGKPGGGMPEK